MRRRFEPQRPLPEMPAPAPGRKAAVPAKRATASKVKPKRRTLCDDCCREIHRLGQGLADYPRGAVWRVTEPDGEKALLCQAHKDERAPS